ncbi:MAG: glycosyltransferase family 4 protein [Cyanobacteria bacterium P01_A01_bin.45]
MNPLILSTFDTSGGAARAAFRLHKGLRMMDINSQMLVEYKSSNDKNVIGAVNKFEKLVNQIRPTLDNLPLKLYPQRQGMFSPQWFPDFIHSKIRNTNLLTNLPDIINLHWICGYLSIETIAKFSQPIVWTFHDMWAISGGCQYSLKCDRYIDNCGNCPILKSGKEQDISRWIWKRKASAWRKIDLVDSNMDLTIVTPSKWLKDCVSSSSLMKGFPVEVIPNGIDLQRYKPVEKDFAREWLNLPQDKQLILFGAAFTSEKRKGIDLLYHALTKFQQTDIHQLVELVVFGTSENQTELKNLNFKIHYLGSFQDDISLALVYAAVDIFIAPSIQDNLPNTVMEALACGTPCVAFNIGGMPDMIEHQRNGYLAPAFEIDQLAHGIEWILSDQKRAIALQKNARQKAEQEFSISLQAQRYSQLFQKKIAARKEGRIKMN